MGREVDSGALSDVGRQLGISGQANPSTDFLEDELAQVFEVSGAVRRARADIGASGWYYGLQQNDHAAAGIISSSIDPYFPGSGISLNGWPLRVPNDFDLWLMGAWIFRSTAGGMTLTSAQLIPGGGPTRNQGFGIDDGGAAVSAGILVSWADYAEADFLSITDTTPMTKIGLRWPRGGMTLGAFTQTAGAGATSFRWGTLWGLFPAGMGQDIATW